MRGFFAGFDRLVVLLGIGQLTGWGTTYYLPGVIGEHFATVTGLSKPMIFGGLTAMLLVSSPLAAFAGRYMDRRGALHSISLSFAILGVGLLVLAAANGPIQYYAAWIIFGIAMPFGLWGGSQVALVQARGHGARRAISYVLMMMSFSQAVFWPLTVWLDGLIGWRATCLLFAVLNFAVAGCFVLIRRAKVVTSAEVEGPVVSLVQPLPTASRGKGALLMVVAMASTGFVSWGMEIHAMSFVMSFGIGQGLALSVIMLRGPVAMTARTIDLFLGSRITALAIAMGACLCFFSAQTVNFLIGGALGAALFVTLFSASTGALSVTRSTLQLSLFGPQGFATLAGRINQPVVFVYAVSPPIYGYVIENWGARTGFVMSMFLLCLSIASLIALRAMAPRATRVVTH